MSKVYTNYIFNIFIFFHYFHILEFCNLYCSNNSYS